MKKYFFVLTAAAALFFTTCKEDQYINSPGDNAYNYESMPIMTPDTNCPLISVDSALAICKAMTVNAESPTKFKLSGVLVNNTTNPMNVPSPYDNINFELSDNGGKTRISCYYTNNLNNRPFRKNSDVPRVGSKLTVVGTLTLYQKSGSSSTTPELKNGFIVRIDSMVAPPPFPGCPEPGEGEISVSEAVKLALQLATSSSSTKYPSEETYNIMGVVTEVLSMEVGSYADYIISDGKSYFEVYHGKGYNNNQFSSTDQLMPNDTVTVNAKLLNFNGTPETSGDAPIVKSTNPNL